MVFACPAIHHVSRFQKIIQSHTDILLAAAVEEIAYASRALGSQLWGVEIGNEECRSSMFLCPY